MPAASWRKEGDLHEGYALLEARLTVLYFCPRFPRMSQSSTSAGRFLFLGDDSASALAFADELESFCTYVGE